MPSTVYLVIVFLGFLLVSIALWAVFLRIGLRWAKVSDATMARVFVVTLAVLAFQLLLRIVLAYAISASPANGFEIAFIVLAFGASIVIPYWIISRAFTTSFPRAIQAWLPTLLSSAVGIALVVFVLRPFLFESYVLPTNSMAPTLVGTHLQSTCPECGSPNYCSVPRQEWGFSGAQNMICDNFHVTQLENVGDKVYDSDRFLSAKFYSPRRWDLIVFEVPNDSQTEYVKRLVGLPGEEIQIRDGAVWVDGKRQTPPDSIDGLVYESEMGGPNELWGSPERPAVLGKDEYFVLGDFSVQAADSRLWHSGASGHPPYAVPGSHITGVVTHTYWPPHRWRVHR